MPYSSLRRDRLHKIELSDFAIEHVGRAQHFRKTVYATTKKIYISSIRAINEQVQMES